MAQFFLYWSEIEDGEFPDCCITCGNDDTEMIRRKLVTRHIGYREYTTVELPFCCDHRSSGFFRWEGIQATSFTDEGVWLKNVSDDFIEEMELLRDELDEEAEKEERRRGRRIKKRREREGGGYFQDYDDEEIDDRPRRSPSSGWAQSPMAVIRLIIVLMAIPALTVACCAGLLGVSHRR